LLAQLFGIRLEVGFGPQILEGRLFSLGGGSDAWTGKQTKLLSQNNFKKRTKQIHGCSRIAAQLSLSLLLFRELPIGSDRLTK
jgi:hypothetical protein